MIDGLAYRSYGLRKQAVRHWLGVSLVLVLAYFAYHSIHGSRGLFAWIDRQHELETKRLELAQIRGERQWLESVVHPWIEARRRQLFDEAPPGTVEQKHAELVLQRVDLAPERRLGHAEGARGGGQRAFLRRHEERPRPVPVELDRAPIHAKMHIKRRKFVNSWRRHAWVYPP